MKSPSKPSPQEHNAYFRRYIDLVPQGDAFELLEKSYSDTVNLYKNIPEHMHEYKYAPNKWSIKQVLMHCIDTERILSYRALVCARGDKTTVLFSFDEDLYAHHADISNRMINELLDEFGSVRQSTLTLFKGIPDAYAKFEGNNAGQPLTANALLYIIIGHVLHHNNILCDRYLR